MSVALPQILQPGTINQVISELRVNNTRLQDFFISGGGTAQVSGRYFAWDVFNDTREVASGRAPGTAPARVTRQPVGNVQGVFPRVHESLQLLYEEIHNQRLLGGMMLDRAGEGYILRQEKYLAQRYANHREMQFAGMIRGSYYYTRNGDDLSVSLSSGAEQINFQVPAGNLAKLNMLGAGDILAASWSTLSTDIPAQLTNIDAAFEQLVGLPLEHIWINGPDFQQYVLQNDKIKGLSGTANVVFDRDERIGQNDRVVVLKGLPNYTWHVTNGVLNFAGTATKIIPVGSALFCPSPDSSWVQLGEGSEVVVEYPGATPTERFGSYFYAEPTTKPAGYELIGVMNCVPYLYVPKCIAMGTIVY